MGRIREYLSIWPAICVVILGLFLAGLGAYFALRESRAAISIRVDALWPRARTYAERVQADFVEETADALREAERAWKTDRTWAFESIQIEAPWIEMFVLYDTGEFRTWPSAPMPVLPIDPTLAPLNYGVGEQLEFVEEDLEGAIKEYRACTKSTSIPWQRRAGMAIAACRLKQGRPAEALSIYDRLLSEVSSLAGPIYEPTPFAIHLARIDTLEALGQHGDAARALRELADRVCAGKITVQNTDEAEFLFDRIERLETADQATLDNLRYRLGALLERQAEQRRLGQLARTWFQARPLLPPPDDEEMGQPHFFFQLAGAEKYGLVRLDMTQVPGEPRAIVGVLDPGIIQSRLQSLLLRKEGGPELTLRSTIQLGRQVGPWSVSMSPHLTPWRIEPAPDFVAEARRRADRQTLAYIGLTILLLGALLLTVYLMVAALRRQLALAELKSQFVANVSHELKTPLALIRLFAETLLAGRVSSTAKAEEYFRIITRESDRLTHLIDNILDFSRIEAGQKQYSKMATDLGRLVAETLATYRHQLEHHGFTHELAVEPNLPLVLVDADAVRQAIINLIDNSVKYSPDEKWLRIRVGRGAIDGKEGVCVELQDRGTGVSAVERRRLFEPFYRVSSEATLSVRGTGLGLTLVKHVVDAHEGRVEVASRPGQGTTFRIVLPATDSVYPSGNSSGTDL